MILPILGILSLLPTFADAEENENKNNIIDRGSFFLAFFVSAIPFTILGLRTYYTHTLQVVVRWKFQSTLKSNGEIVHAKVLNSSVDQIDTPWIGMRRAYTLLVEYETNQILAEKTNERPLNVSTRIKVTSQEFASATESGTIDVVVYPGHPEYAWTHQMVYQQHQQPIPTSNMERFCVKILSLILPIPLLSMGIISCVICYNENDPLQKFTVGLFLIFVSSIFWGITTV